MKKYMFVLSAATLFAVACQKASTEDAIALTASSTEVSTGQTVSVTASTNNANALRWTVTPPTNAKGIYTVTTEKTNYYTFTTAGTYTIGVRARRLPLDSIHTCHPLDSLGHHYGDSVWNHHIGTMWQQAGHDRGGCQKGQDSAAITIKVI